MLSNMSNNTINNDIDLYYYLNVNKNVKNLNNNTDILLNDYDINEYEKMIDEIYNDNDTIIIKSANNSDNYKSYENCELNIIDKNKNKKKNTSKKILYCEECNNDDIIEDTSQGIIVCTNCGFVIESLMDMGAEWTQYNDDNKKDMSRCSHAISQLLPQSSMATTISGSCSSRIKTLHGWSAMPYKERSLNDVFKIIQNVCIKGKIIKCIEDDAKIMYKNIYESKHLDGKNLGKKVIKRGKNRISLIAASVLYACRKKDKTRSPKEIAELFDLKCSEITKGCKIFQQIAKNEDIELKLNVIKPEHFITRFCEEYKIKNKYIKQAIQITNNIQKLQIATVHTPLSLATGSIYMMICLNKLDIQKKNIAEKFNVSHVTITKAYKKLEPFTNLLTNDELCNRLSMEIKKYQDNIELPNKLKSKFIRFNIDINKTFDSDYDNLLLYNILELDSDENYYFNIKLIVEHSYEIDNKIKQLDNEFIRLNINFIDDIYNLNLAKYMIK